MKKLLLATVAAVGAVCMFATVPSAQPGNGKALGQNKEPVCHNGKTLHLPAPAVAAHERHGDMPGACTTPTPPPPPPPGGDLVGLPGTATDTDGNRNIDLITVPGVTGCTIAPDAAISFSVEGQLLPKLTNGLEVTIENGTAGLEIRALEGNDLPAGELTIAATTGITGCTITSPATDPLAGLSPTVVGAGLPGGNITSLSWPELASSDCIIAPDAFITLEGVAGTSLEGRTFLVQNGEGNQILHFSDFGIVAEGAPGSLTFVEQPGGTSTTLSATGAEFKVVDSEGIDCTVGGTLTTSDGAPALMTASGDTLKLKAKSAKDEKRLEALAEKKTKVKVTGKKSGDTLEVSQLKTKKAKK